MSRGTHTYAEMDVSEATWDEIARKLRAAGYDHAFLRSDRAAPGVLDTLDMHGIGLVHEQRPRMLKLVDVGASERVQWAADTVYQLAVTHMTAGLRVANRLRAEAGQPPLSLAEIMELLGLTA